MRAEALLGEIAERLQRVVGAKSALLPADMQRRSGVRQRWARREPIPRDLDGFIARSEPLADFRIAYDDDVIDLLRLVVLVETYPDRFRRIIRFFDGDEAPHPKFSDRAMWVSDDALRSVGLMGSDIKVLATQIARQLVELPERSRR